MLMHDSTQASLVISLVSCYTHYELVGYWDIAILGRYLS